MRQYLGVKTRNVSIVLFIGAAITGLSVSAALVALHSLISDR